MRSLREKNNLRLMDVATAIDVAESTVRNWEKGRTIPHLTLGKFLILAEMYRVTLHGLEDVIAETFADAA